MKHATNCETAAEELAVLMGHRAFNLMFGGRMHQDFKSRFGSTCCQVLIKNGTWEFPRHFAACCDRCFIINDRLSEINFPDHCGSIQFNLDIL